MAYAEENDAKIRDIADRSVEKFEVADSYSCKAMSHAELIAEAVRDSDQASIVKDLIYRKTVNIGVGDSGLGKTPFFIQLAVCVAFGLPFVGQECERGRVLIADYENYTEIANIVSAIADCLGLSKPLDGEWLKIIRNPDKNALFKEIEEFRPRLVIVDALRGFDSDAEEKNPAACKMIAECQTVAMKTDCAWIFIHHLRKQDKKAEKPCLFKSSSVMPWFQEAAGSHALINQTHTRIGFQIPADQENSELGLRGWVKGRGDFGPWFIDREYGETGEPIGYRRVCGINLLSEKEKEFLTVLPVDEPMSFTEILDRIPDGHAKRRPQVAKLLKRCVAVNVIKTAGKDHTPSKTYTRLKEEA